MPTKTHWSDWECESLKSLFEQGFSDQEIARALNRPFEGTQKKRQILGLYRVDSLIEQLLKLSPEELTKVFGLVICKLLKKEEPFEHSDNGGLARECFFPRRIPVQIHGEDPPETD